MEKLAIFVAILGMVFQIVIYSSIAYVVYLLLKHFGVV